MSPLEYNCQLPDQRARGRRILAGLVDGVVLFLLLLPIWVYVFALSFGGHQQPALVYLLHVLAYLIALGGEAITGLTGGKRLLSLRIVPAAGATYATKAVLRRRWIAKHFPALLFAATTGVAVIPNGYANRATEIVGMSLAIIALLSLLLLIVAWPLLTLNGIFSQGRRVPHNWFACTDVIRTGHPRTRSSWRI